MLRGNRRDHIVELIEMSVREPVYDRIVIDVGPAVPDLPHNAGVRLRDSVLPRVRAAKTFPPGTLDAVRGVLGAA
jgi:cellulose biosynthesis protein BcsQ